MGFWLGELLLRVIVTPLVLHELGDHLFVNLAAVAAIAGSLPWLAPDNALLARVGYIARRLQAPPEGPRSRRPTSTAGWSRLTFRAGVVWVACADAPADAAVFVALSALLLWIIDGLARWSRWLHPSRQEQGAALGGRDQLRFFQRALDAMLWFSLWPAIVMWAFGPRLVSLWLHRPAPTGMVELFAVATTLAAVAFVSGQWLQKRTTGDLVARVVRAEAWVVTAISVAGLPLLGALAPIAALVLGQLALSCSRLLLACCRTLQVPLGPWCRRRLGVAALVSGPAIAFAVGAAVLRPPTSTVEVWVSVALVTVAHLVSTVTWWNLSARQGL